MTVPALPPGAERFDVQGTWGPQGEHVIVEWYGTTDDPPRVAAWFRVRLRTYTEGEPGSWIHRDTASFHRVLVAPARRWPAAWPQPPDPPPHLATLIMSTQG